MTDLEKLRFYCDKLRLGNKAVLTTGDHTALRSILCSYNEFELAEYIESLNDVNELHDLLVNEVYND